jgi:hypothetical protein
MSCHHHAVILCETAYLRILDVPDIVPTVSRTPSYPEELSAFRAISESVQGALANSLVPVAPYAASFLEWLLRLNPPTI